MDAITRERYGPPGALTREQQTPRLPPPVQTHCRVKVANSARLCGRPAGHNGAHWPAPRRAATDQTWEDYRAEHYARVDARLAEARRDGTDDSWWEEPDG